MNSNNSENRHSDFELELGQWLSPRPNPFPGILKHWERKAFRSLSRILLQMERRFQVQNQSGESLQGSSQKYGQKQFQELHQEPHQENLSPASTVVRMFISVLNGTLSPLPRSEGRNETPHWGHLYEALLHLGFFSPPDPSQKTETSTPREHQEKIAILLVEVAAEKKALIPLSETPQIERLEEFLPRYLVKKLSEARIKGRQDRLEFIQRQRQKLLNQFEVLSSQGMFPQAELAFQEFLTRFPEDQEIQRLRKEHQNRLAHHYLESGGRIRSPHRTRELIQSLSKAPRDPEEDILLEGVFLSMKKNLLESNSDLVSNSETILESISESILERMALDFSVAFVLWEDTARALSILNLRESSVPLSKSDQPIRCQWRLDSLWFSSELKLRERRFLELLTELDTTQNLWGQDPELVFTAHYLRAQCLWGLSKKKEALEMMEGIVTLRPQYRSAATLLSDWRSES